MLFSFLKGRKRVRREAILQKLFIRRSIDVHEYFDVVFGHPLTGVHYKLHSFLDISLKVHLLLVFGLCNVFLNLRLVLLPG